MHRVGLEVNQRGEPPVEAEAGLLRSARAKERGACVRGGEALVLSAERHQ
ncbi:hypothetical protein HMPREF1556_00812 [Porphyromonas sp. oral taxon 278 str. W7784]|nr:hypothetical protein HMPREF1556_00812 [Porphyromonas sp. oral taxon 278 str. W7784]